VNCTIQSKGKPGGIGQKDGGPLTKQTGATGLGLEKGVKAGSHIQTGDVKIDPGCLNDEKNVRGRRN